MEYKPWLTNYQSRKKSPRCGHCGLPITEADDNHCRPCPKYVDTRAIVDDVMATIRAITDPA